MTNIYVTCETTFAAFATANSIDYAAVEFETSAASLPDKFFIYRVLSDSDVAFYNNISFRREFQIQVALFFKDKTLLKTLPDTLDTAMITAGYKPQGNGRDTPRLDSGHFGWSKDYTICLTR